MSVPYSPAVDRQSNPIVNQGAVIAGAAIDVGAKITVQLENKDGMSLYRGADDEDVWTITPTDLLFTAPSKSGSSANTQLAVLPALNGFGANASRIYPNDPHMVRAAVKTSIQSIGAAYQWQGSDRPSQPRGISVQMAGFKTLPLGYSADDDMNYIKPGDLVCAEVPLPNRQFSHRRGDSAHSVIARGAPPNKTTLQMRRCSPYSASQALLMHIREILENPARWKHAMGERLLGTAAWATAAHNVMNSYLVGGLIMVRELLAANILKGNAVPGLNIPSFAALNAAANDNARSDAANGVVEALAKVVGVIDDRGALTGALRPGTDAYEAVNGLRSRVLNRIFYDGSNPAHEHGHSKSGGFSNSNGRYANKEVNMRTDTGRFLHLQLNHATRAVAGFHAAILDDLRFIIGKAATGASPQGSGNAHVMLGIARQ
jgi:hypothetical protein